MWNLLVVSKNSKVQSLGGRNKTTIQHINVQNACKDKFNMSNLLKLFFVIGNN
jgi:hypothetical protein